MSTRVFKTWFEGKTFWRRPPDAENHHAFVNTGENRWVSLCGRFLIKKRIGGGAARRPEAILRCARCDVLEIQRFGKMESLDPTVHLLNRKD